MVTLRDVATAAGCSTATVSRALNGDPRISERRRREIHDEAARLGYQVNQIARSLRRQKTGYVGVIIPNVYNNYYNHLLSHVTDELAVRGFHVVLGCHHFDPAEDARLIHSLIDRKVEGLLHVPCTRRGFEGALVDFNIPVVEFGQHSESTRVDAVYIDDAQGIHRVVQYLYDLGHRRIVMLAGRVGVPGVDAQSRGFAQAVQELGLSPDVTYVVHSPVNHHDFSVRLNQLFDAPKHRRPTAIIGAHTFAIGATVNAVRAKDIGVPNEISIVGFSNDDWFEASNPPVTTYEHPYRSMSIVATQMLLSRLRPNPDHPSRPDTVKFEGQILERASAGPPP